MTVLDCESAESTYASLEQILGITRLQLDGVFESFDVQRFYDETPQCGETPDRVVFSEVRKCASRAGDYEATAWFHLTRTAPGNRFDEGILPLGHALDQIWQFLGSLVPKLSRDAWAAFRRKMESEKSSWRNDRLAHFAYLYRLKVSNSQHWGPYAILVRDHAFRTGQTGDHDYLNAPEIIEDICICFADRHSFDLMAAFTATAKPCIVKFIDQGVQRDCLAAATYHLYNRLRGFGCSMDCNTCYDAEGRRINAGQILRVEFPLAGADPLPPSSRPHGRER